MANRSYWLVNSNRSRVKRVIENTNNKYHFLKYMLIDSGKLTSRDSKDPSYMTTREELKKDVSREESKKLITHSWRRTKEDWTKKRARTAHP